MKKKRKKSKFWSFKRARRFVRKLGLKSQKDWECYVKKGGNKPLNIPYHPDRYYKKGWKGMMDWIGTEYLSFSKARKFVRSLKLNGYNDWNNYCKGENKSKNIPSRPGRFYRNCGWKGIRNWLGIENKFKLWSFKKARRFVRKLGLKNGKEWKNYCRSHQKPYCIPSNPWMFYKDQWINLFDWLGTQPKQFLSFKEARMLVRKLKLKGQKEFREYRSQHRLDLPCDPHETYKNKGWKDGYDWLGKTKEIDFRVRNRQYNVNHNFFKKWSHDMAYILGLWFADGCIINGASFIITLHKRDKYLLNEIQDKMGSNYLLYKNKNCYYFSITSDTIYKDIISLGGVERKSLIISFPNVPKKFIHDFIRGYFDGDGWVTCDKNRKKYKIGFVSGSKKFIYKLFLVLKKEISGFKARTYRKINLNYIKRNGKHPVFFTINASANSARLFREFIYKDLSCIKMKRKYEKLLGAGDTNKNNIKNKLTKFVSFKKAKMIAINNNFKSLLMWKKYAREHADIPVNPQKVYKKNWPGWHVFLGHDKNVEAKRI